MCAQAGHEDAMLTFRDATPDKIWKFVEVVKRQKAAGVSAAQNGAAHTVSK
jgi:hypothetical protein